MCEGVKMRTSALTLVLFAAFTLAPCFPALAQGTPAPGHSNFGKAIIPAGPFSAWPAETRDAAVRKLRFRCLMFAGMVFDNYSGPKDAGAKDMAAIASTCVAMAMPDDWPGQAAERAQAASLYSVAKQLDPKVPDPSFVANALSQAH
jgi:hypothetical protein